MVVVETISSPLAAGAERLAEAWQNLDTVGRCWVTLLRSGVEDPSFSVRTMAGEFIRAAWCIGREVRWTHLHRRFYSAV